MTGSSSQITECKSSRRSARMRMNVVPTAPTLLAVLLVAPILERRIQIQEMDELRGRQHNGGSPKATPRHPIEDSGCRFCIRKRGNEKSHGKKSSVLQPRHDQAHPGNRLAQAILPLAEARASFRQPAMKISRSPPTAESLLRKLLLP